jgi:hypothetical protein
MKVLLLLFGNTSSAILKKMTEEVLPNNACSIKRRAILAIPVAGYGGL